MPEFGARVVKRASETADPSGLPDRNMVKIQGLQARADLNGLFASVLDLPTRNGRIGIKVCASKERVWIKRENIVPLTSEWVEEEGGNPEVEAMYKSIEGARRGDPNAKCYVITLANGKKHELWTPQWFELASKEPAPAPAPAAAAIPSTDHENPWDFSDSEDERARAPAPAADRRAAARATLRNMVQENDPRPHYCIYCGSEGLYGDKCAPCGFYRGSHCFGPNGPLQKGDTLMGRKLTYVKWPWQGDPEAPYVRAGVLRL